MIADDIAASILSSGTEPAPLGYKRNWWAHRWILFQDWRKWQTGRFLNWLGVPGFIRPMEMYDELITHSLLQVRVTPLFTIVTVDGKDFYFYRISGKYDGTGMSGSWTTSQIDDWMEGRTRL